MVPTPELKRDEEAGGAHKVPGERDGEGAAGVPAAVSARLREAGAVSEFPGMTGKKGRGNAEVPAAELTWVREAGTGFDPFKGRMERRSASSSGSKEVRSVIEAVRATRP